MNKYIAWLTSILVFLIAVGSFILSYNALYQVALANGIDERLCWLWPLLIDVPLVVFSLCAIVAYQYNESTWQLWLLVAGYLIATMLFNVLHAWPAMLPLLIARIIVTCIPPLSLLLSFEVLMMRFKNHIECQGLSDSAIQLNILVSEYSTQLSDVDTRITQTLQRLTLLQQEIDDPVSVRRQRVAQMRANGISQKAMAGELGISIGTVRSDIKALNGNGK